MKKRILSMLLATVMVVSLLPTMNITAEAAGAHSNHCLCGTMHQDIGDHTEDSEVTFQKYEFYWSGWNPAPAFPTSGCYYMTTRDPSLTQISVPEVTLTGDLTICLNGMSLTSAKNNQSYMFKLNGNTLTITDCKNSGCVSIVNGYGDVIVAGDSYSTPKVNLYNGTIVGNGGESAIKVNDNSNLTFNQYGGTVSARYENAGNGITVNDKCKLVFAQYGGTFCDFENGIRIWSSVEGEVLLKTMPNFTDCTNDIYFQGSTPVHKVKFDGKLDPIKDNPTTVAAQKSEYVFTSGWTTTFGSDDFGDYFAPAEGYEVQWNGTELSVRVGAKAITKAAAENGTFEIKKSSATNSDIIDRAYQYDYVYVHATPDSGYAVGSVTYKDTYGTRTASKYSDGVYFFTMPGNPTTVNVTFVVPVSSVTLNETSKTLTIGESFTLTPIIAPENAANKNVNWYSNNRNVATVNNGVVTAIGEGTATITATAADGSGQKATCIVTVTAAAPTTYTVTPAPTENGRFTVKVGDDEATTAAAGETVTITASPAENYAVNTVTVKDASNNDVAVTDNGDGTYSFTMPASYVTVSVTFKILDPKVASVTFEGTTTSYTTIDAAWAAAIACNTTANEKATITLLDSCATADTLTNTEDYIVLDTNGKTLTCNHSRIDANGICNNGGSLEVIGNGKVTSNTAYTTGDGVLGNTEGTLIIDGAWIYNSGNNTSYPVVNKGEFHFVSGKLQSNENMSGEDLRALMVRNGGTAYMYSGTLIANTNNGSALLVSTTPPTMGNLVLCYSEQPLTIISNNVDKIFNDLSRIKVSDDIVLDITYGPNADGTGTTTVTNQTEISNEVNASKYLQIKTKRKIAITAEANPANGGTVTGSGSYGLGTTATLTATPATGYSFVNWTENGTEVSTDATYSFTATENAEYVANFEEYHTHCVCGATHAAIGTHITEENPTWIAISSASDFTKNKDSGYYYLTNDIEVSAKWDFTESRDIVLCLNGYDITYTGSSNVSFIPGSTTLNFTLTDCQDDAGSISGFKNTNGGAINVKKAFTMYNGKITGNTANQGGGVYVDQNATFYMYGGEITGNTASSIGGGVFSKGSMEVAGAPVVNNNESSNTATTYPSSMYKYTKNIYSSTGAIRVGTGGLATGALLDVTPMFPASSSEKPAAVAVIATGCTSDLSEYFTYTSGFDYIKQYDAAKGEVQLVYNPVKYIVTFDMQGHGTQLEPQEVETGTYALEPTPAPTAVGYQFGGWYITPECGYWDDFIFDFSKITANTTLYAKWTEKATVSISEDVQAYTWDGNAKAFIISGNPDTNFVVQYKVNDNWTETAPSAMGTYDVKITREEDTIYKAYEKMIGGGLVINAATPTVTVPTVEADLVYDGTSQSLIAEGTSENGHWEYSLDGTNYLTTVPAGTDAKTYTVYCNFVPNTGYTGVDPVELSVTIAPKEVALDWAELTAAELVYNGTAKTLTATATDLVVGDSCTVTVELVGDNINAGTFSYKATALSNANYKLPPNISSPEYTITPKTLTITADDKEVYVGNDQPELTYTVEGLVGSDVLITAPTLSTDANMYKAGTYAITFANEAAAGNNYSITYVNGTLTVKNHPYSPTITPIYDVKIADDITGGEVSASRKLAYKGTTITITIAPDAGYELAKLIVTDSRGNAVAVTKASDNTYTFKMPASKITVKAAFAVENPFEDVSSDAYYYDAVLWAVKVGITSGTGATTFSPDNPCTRAQMATFLWRAAGSPDPVSKTCIFADVPADAYYATAVQWAYEQGITSGTGATTYSPDEPCTRGQMATFLWRNAGSRAPVSNTNRFADVPAVKYYAVAVQWAYEQGITSGTSATTYSPDEPCTRGQVVTFLYRYYVK